MNEHDQNLGQETVWSPWQTMVFMVNIDSNGLKKGAYHFFLGKYIFIKNEKNVSMITY